MRGGAGVDALGAGEDRVAVAVAYGSFHSAAAPISRASAGDAIDVVGIRLLTTSATHSRIRATSGANHRFDRLSIDAASQN